MLLVIGGGATSESMSAAPLAADGWDVIGPVPASEAGAIAARAWPSLILLDTGGATGDGAAPWIEPAVARSPIATIPVILRGAAPPGWPPDGVDQHLPAAITPEEIVAALRPWRPDDPLAGARRLEAIFGAAEIQAMVAALRGQLVEAVARFDRSADAGLAHRVAGIAGTLGFAAVGRHWLALSEGEAAAWPDARRAARMAIAAIDRDLGRA